MLPPDRQLTAAALLPLGLLSWAVWFSTEAFAVDPAPPQWSQAAEARAMLRRFSPDADSIGALRQLIDQLGDDEYHARQNAAEELLGYPILPKAIIQEGIENPDFEIRQGVRWVVASRPPSHGEALLAEQLQEIRDAKLRGLTADILAALSRFDNFSLREIATEAIAATMPQEQPGDDDFALLRDSLSHDNPLIRIVAIDLLVARADASLLGDLKTRLDDPDPRVKLEAAMRLGDHSDRSCLSALVDLLWADDANIRQEAAESLRAVSGKWFGFTASDPIDQRTAPAKAWADWAKGPGLTDPLVFPIDRSRWVDLFADNKLSQWTLIRDGRTILPQSATLICRLDKGVLNCGRFQGNLLTRQTLKDYRLTLQWQWPESPRVTVGVRDGGVLLMHSGEPSGDPKDEGSALEVNLLSGNAGDFHPLGEFHASGLRTGAKSRLAEGSEKPIGQWNRMEVEVRQGTVTVKINDVLQNKGTGLTVREGRIGLRIEDSPIRFRNVSVLPLE